MKKFITITIISLLVITLFLLWAKSNDVKNAPYRATENVEELGPVGQLYENQGQVHIKPGKEHPPFNSNPPTSGWHWVNPASWGVHDNELVDEQAVHNLEHGGIWISYRDISDVTLGNLEKIAKANSGSVILSPRDANDAKIVLASWLRLEQMEEYDEAKIIEFISRNKNNSPEPFAN